jgi:chaperonin GroEL
MMSKLLLHGDEARKRLLSGMKKLNEVVSSTMGPYGRTCVIERAVDTKDGRIWYDPQTTKDGVTCARSIHLGDSNEEMGAALLRQAANKTVSQVGDGTTATCLLGTRILELAMASPRSFVDLRREIACDVDTVAENLGRAAEPLGDRAVLVATLAANGSAEIGHLVAQAITAAGEDGSISIDNSRTAESRVEATAGLKFASGYKVENFVTDPATGVCTLDHPYLLMLERRVTALPPYMKLMDTVFKSGRPLLFLCEDFEFDILQIMVANRTALKSCCVVVPYYGDRRKAFLGDIAAVCGGVALTDELGIPLDKVGLEHLGSCDSAIVTRNSTTILGGKGEPVDLLKRIVSLRKAREASESDYEQGQLAERIALLAGQVAVIKVGGTTAAEQSEKKDRVEDAVGATMAAVREGVVVGAGVGLADAASSLSADSIVREACSAPYNQICLNAGHDVEVTTDILDPVAVVKASLRNAASIATLVLSCEGTVSEALKDGR